jgi:hypothetical protein
MKHGKVIGSYGLSNYGGLSIYELDDECIEVGYYNDKPRTYKLYYNTKGVYFNYGRLGRIYLSEIMRIGA